jgi:hypothetical protein
LSLRGHAVLVPVCPAEPALRAYTQTASGEPDALLAEVVVETVVEDGVPWATSTAIADALYGLVSGQVPDGVVRDGDQQSVHHVGG